MSSSFNLLLAESGSTKTDWCLVHRDGSISSYKTSGINPYLQSEEQIFNMLRSELDTTEFSGIESLFFYGAGASTSIQQDKLQRILSSFFKARDVSINCDMLGAARALCGHESGITCILGTGSNSCFYDGGKIVNRQVSLGYIAGDEGSGNHLGKRVLQYYAYQTFDEELKIAFELRFGKDMGTILRKLYAEPFPNRYLASFVTLLVENRGHYMVENIIEDCLNDFFHQHLMKYRQSWNAPIHFTGSVAYEFQDVLKILCTQYKLEFGKVVKHPLEGLIKFHTQGEGHQKIQSFI